MTKTQLDNLIKFNLLFKTVVCNVESADYIEEKWNKFIGIPLVEQTLDDPSDALLTWQNLWGADDALLPMVDMIFTARTIPFVKDLPSDMLDRFGKTFDIEQVRDTPAIGLHATLKPVMELWIKQNIRDYNLCLLT